MCVSPSSGPKKYSSTYDLCVRACVCVMSGLLMICVCARACVCDVWFTYDLCVCVVLVLVFLSPLAYSLVLSNTVLRSQHKW